MIHTLLPLNLYSVGYELVRGRPYSPLEAMLLRAALETPPDRGSTFADLRAVFRVHDRLLTEALVTLIQEGWVAMRQVGQEMHFMITDEGTRTVESGRQPESILVRARRQGVAMERLSGRLIRASELMMGTRSMLRRVQNGRPFQEGLPPRVQRTKLNVGEVERLLPRSDQHQEWIRWIDPAVRVSQDVHYLPLQVDLEAGRVFGLPPQWQDMSELVIRLITENTDEFDLGPEFEDAVRAAARKNKNGTTVVRDERPVGSDEYLSTSVADADIAVSTEEKRLLLDDFAAVATGSVFVVANGLTTSTAATVKTLVEPLLKRGVNVDLMWSGEQDDDKAVSSALQKARGGAGAGKLTLLGDARDMATDLVLGATPSGPVALLGTSLFAQTDHGVIAQLSGYRALTSLARLCAGWWEEGASDTAVPVFRWRHAAEEWACEAARESDTNDTTNDRKGECVARMGTMALIFTHHLPVALRDHPTAAQAPGQWFLDTGDHLLVANAGKNSMHFLFTGPIQVNLMNRLSY